MSAKWDSSFDRSTESLSRRSATDPSRACPYTSHSPDIGVTPKFAPSAWNDVLKAEADVSPLSNAFSIHASTAPDDEPTSGSGPDTSAPASCQSVNETLSTGSGSEETASSKGVERCRTTNTTTTTPTTTMTAATSTTRRVRTRASSGSDLPGI